MRKEVRLAWRKIREEKARLEFEEHRRRWAERRQEEDATRLKSAKALAMLLAARFR
jgi:hypothetical protein